MRHLLSHEAFFIVTRKRAAPHIALRIFGRVQSQSPNSPVVRLDELAPKIDEYDVGGPMNRSVRGCVVDETTGEPLTSPDVRLYRIGVAGETCTTLNEHGCFSFSDLSEGEYSLAFYDRKFVPRYERLSLVEGQTMNALQIALRPGGLLSGTILDEKQQPPELSRARLWCSASLPHRRLYIQKQAQSLRFA